MNLEVAKVDEAAVSADEQRLDTDEPPVDAKKKKKEDKKKVKKIQSESFSQFELWGTYCVTRYYWHLKLSFGE